MPKPEKPKRKQLNIGVTPEQYEVIQGGGAGRRGDRHRVLPRRHPVPRRAGAGGGSPRLLGAPRVAASRAAIPQPGQGAGTHSGLAMQ